MAQTKEGAVKAAKKILQRDPDHFKKIGSKGGQNKTGVYGFSLMTPEERSRLGSIGGKISKRKSKKPIDSSNL